MKKFRVKIYTIHPELCPECVMDEHMINETLTVEEERFLKIEDDIWDNFFILNIDHIVGIECIEIKD